MKYPNKQSEKRLSTARKDSRKPEPAQIPHLINELEVHRIELGVQNDELLRSQLELEQAKEHFSHLFDFAPITYLIFTATGQILQANLASTNLLDMPRLRLCGRNFFQFVAKEQRQKLYQHLRYVFNTELRHSCELELILADKSGVFVKMDSVLYPNAKGETPQCLTLVSDISESRQAAAINLQASAVPDEKRQTNSHFLSKASHDLRQPLQAMTTINEILKSKLTNGELLGLLQNQSECLDNMKELLNALLNVSQLESGSITPRISEFPVDQLLQRIGSSYRPCADRKGLRLRVTRCSAVIRSDPVLLGQILDSLVSNAINYTENGKILVGCRRCGSLLRIEVWDTGIGIPKNKRKQIFHDFYQIGNSVRGRGLGLGLGIASRAAGLIGTEIELQRWGNGSRFSVEAQLTPLKSGHANIPTSVTNEGSTEQAISVLVVDDNKIVLFSLTYLLENLGHKVTGAESIEDALEKIKYGAKPIDLVITDYRLLEGQTGIELIKSVRQAMSMDMPALIITGDLEMKNAQDLPVSGIKILQKPVSGDLLNQQIKEMLAKG